MKKSKWLRMAFFSLIILSGCTSYMRPVNTTSDPLKEEWVSKVNTNTDQWTDRASPWFLTGDIGQLGKKISIPDFERIQIEVPVKVRIVGQQERPSVFLKGPVAVVRFLGVKVRHNTLYIYSTTDQPLPYKQITVTVGVRNLNRLTQQSFGSIEGRYLNSKRLAIYSHGNGNLLLNGQINLTQLTQQGTGTISILGVRAPAVTIRAEAGRVNLTGEVGVQSIDQSGTAKINIVGANTDSLKITAAGKSSTNVTGQVNLKKITASDESQVYVYWVKSPNLDIKTSENSKVGLAGIVKNLNVETAGSSRFEGNKLKAEEAYIRSVNYSQASAQINQKLFASASGRSSIYFYGDPAQVSRHITGDSVVLPMNEGGVIKSQIRTAFLTTGPALSDAPKRSALAYNNYKGEGAYRMGGAVIEEWSAPTHSEQFSWDSGDAPVRVIVKERPLPPPPTSIWSVHSLKAEGVYRRGFK